jgi:hypothetical protein
MVVLPVLVEHVVRSEVGLGAAIDEACSGTAFRMLADSMLLQSPDVFKLLLVFPCTIG